ncbi:MOSC domain-containing protein [Dyadobacter flavalbus]|uniref:MOSC domain-containing protein n=1 Tax=Dyadobacter flavalbus TaxID=2579942 RepID=A0A5M8QSK5_9BACT|nr:MOSC domain-containing protein [Dyadobacter flavalbus]KAA6438211.1 MOSC domain-containing protein [Dyadobacter flavalbus]
MDANSVPIVLTEIWIYPVKSLGGIRLTESYAEEKGLQYDRRWMIVDENGIFLTQRTNPKMATITVFFHDLGLLLSSRSDPSNQIPVPFKRVSDEALLVKVWNDSVTAYTVCHEADVWLSEMLEKKVRIVEMTASSDRRMNAQDAEPDTTLSFADDFPYLLISEASLHELNRRLEQPVEMNRFRPNFVVSGTEPFAEDAWKYIQIGNVGFHVAKPCERCVLTTVDQQTGIKGREPLKTLATFRKHERSVLFGQNLIGLQTGNVREGNQIIVSDYKWIKGD